uniref:Latrophilin Cirl n=1 Tax=Ceratitis capitata TaxID=7213 RepID=W8ANH2_CERCA
MHTTDADYYYSNAAEAPSPYQQQAVQYSQPSYPYSAQYATTPATPTYAQDHYAQTLQQIQQQQQLQQQQLLQAQQPQYASTPKSVLPQQVDQVQAAYLAYQQQQQQQLQQHRRHASAAMMQQQLSSDEEQLDQAAAAHAHLLHLGRRAGSQLPPPPAPASHAYHYPHSHHSPEFMGAAHTPTQRYYRNKRSNCDLSHEEYDPSGRAGSEQYYNQNSMGGDGPVYEEILSNRNSDVQHYEMDLNMYGVADDDDDDEDERRACNDDELENERSSAMRRALRQQHLRQRHHYEAARNGVIGGGGVGNNGGGSRYGHAESGASSEEDDDDDDEEEAECESAQRRGLPQGDERMRRLIAMQDEEFQRRFQRQRKKGEGALNDKPATAYFDHHNAPAPSGSSSGGGGGGVGATVFGISGGGSGGAGSIRAIKKISPNNRIGGVHELFTTTHGNNSSGGGSGFGPPLPPANQHQQQQQHQQQLYPLPKRQQLSPTTLTATATATTPSSSHPQPIIGRNISAMLDENNTVRCYLEPLPK